MTNLLDKLSESVPSWGAKLAIGDKVTINGEDILPVALVGFGFGAGEGSGELPETEGAPVKTGEGSGGGGGGYSLPIGAYIGGEAGVNFRPNLIALLAVAIPLVSVTGLALAKIIKAAR